MTLNDVQGKVYEGWTSLGYSPEFRKRRSPYKDLDHALKHVRKAIQKIENLTEDADHLGWPGRFVPDLVKDALSDAVISIARTANTFPGGPIDLEVAVAKRLAQKMTPKTPAPAKRKK